MAVRAGALAWGLLLVTAAVVAFAPDREMVSARDVPTLAPSPNAWLHELEGLRVDAPAGGSPRWRAGRAWPDDGGGTLTVGGLVLGLGLENVAVEIAGSRPWLEAARGRVEAGAGALELDGGVSIAAADGRRALVAARCRVDASGFTFPGPVVFTPAAGAARTERDVRLTADELARALGW